MLGGGLIVGANSKYGKKDNKYEKKIFGVGRSCDEYSEGLKLQLPLPHPWSALIWKRPMLNSNRQIALEVSVDERK